MPIPPSVAIDTSSGSCRAQPYFNPEAENQIKGFSRAIHEKMTEIFGTLPPVQTTIRILWETANAQCSCFIADDTRVRRVMSCSSGELPQKLANQWSYLTLARVDMEEALRDDLANIIANQLTNFQNSDVMHSQHSVYHAFYIMMLSAADVDVQSKIWTMWVTAMRGISPGETRVSFVERILQLAREGDQDVWPHLLDGLQHVGYRITLNAPNPGVPNSAASAA